MHVLFVETVVLFSTLVLCDLAYIWRCIDFFKHCTMVSWLAYSIAVSNFLISCLVFFCTSKAWSYKYLLRANLVKLKVYTISSMW